ncbi:MAG: sugar ABC transporter permease [Chloroflexi bacterium]|nr:sugar ABC transporter permease [Chloroflexota bacterium]
MKRPLSLAKREAIWGYILAAPMLLGVLIFFYLPLGASLLIGFTKWDVLTAPEWVGLNNYINLFREPLFYKTVWNTTRYALMVVPAGLVVSLTMALALNKHIRFRSVYRLIYFLPVLTIPVAIALVWQWIYNPQYGLFAQMFGIKVQWLTDMKMAMPALAIMAIWMGSGYGMVIFLAGLQNIPQMYYEAAKVDGANAWQQFIHITLPLLTPTIFFNLLTSLISAFQTFDIVYIMTQGGPLNTTRTMVYTIWEDAFHYFRMGSATAQAWILFAIILVISLLQFRSQKRWVHYA